MNEQNGGYSIPSQEDFKKSGMNFEPLPSDIYIVKVGKIVLNYVPTYNGSVANWNRLTAGWNLTLLPYSLYTGEPIRLNVSTKEGPKELEIKPLTRRLWTKFTFNSLGFKLDGSPSKMRAFLAYISGQAISGQLKTKDFVVINGNGDLVTDAKERATCIRELTHPEEPSVLLKEKGYKLAPDITEFEGEYIGVVVDKVVSKKTGKETNIVKEFRALPRIFQKPTPESEKEAMDKFHESFNKKLQDLDNEGKNMITYTKDGAYKKDAQPTKEPDFSEDITEVLEEDTINIEDIPFES